MKNLPLIFVIAWAICLAGCSTDDRTENPGGNYNDFDLFGVSKWDNPDNFALLKYYTLVDTITLKEPKIYVVIKAKENTPASVSWNIDGINYESIVFAESSTEPDDISVTRFEPYVDYSFEYAHNMQIKAVARVDKNEIKREALIDGESRIRDVLCVNFGMSSELVRQEIELVKGEGKFTIRDADTAVENSAPHFIYSHSASRTIYTFSNDRLVEVAEFPNSILENEGEINAYFLAFCKRLGMQEETIHIQDGLLVGNPTWIRESERGGIRFTLVMRDDVFPTEEGSGYLPNSIGISYELL